MTTQTPTSATSRWMAYAVTAALGAAFAVVLLVNAWRTVLEDARRDFEVESASLRSLVTANIRNSDEVLSSLADFLAASDPGDRAALQRYAESMIDRHPFIVATIVSGEGGGEGTVVVAADEARREAVGALVDTGELPARLQTGRSVDAVVPAGVFDAGALADHYLLVRAVPGDGPARTAGIVIDSGLFAAAGIVGARTGLQLIADSHGVTGRQVLVDKPLGPATGGGLSELTMETRIQFPYYSMRLTAGKRLYWRDLDLGLLLIAVVIGGGTLLLMMALAHSKEAQARELQRRNELIEQQVIRQTRELAEARDAALEASRVKSDFLASMSHEIRTPLNAIIGMAELLSETPLDADQDKYVGVFKKAGEALLDLVNDILDLSKIEAGQLELERIDFRLADLLDAVTEIYALKCSEKGLTLSCNRDPNVPEYLRGDPSRLRQVLLNLVSNAIKFTEQGEIRIDVVPEPGQPAGAVQFAVSDTGIGIPPGKLESIFASFTQVDSSTTRKYGGTGLGLTISQRLVRMMDGRIWVESSEGEGSTFSFTARFDVGEAVVPTEDVRAERDLHDLRVLVVDDNESNRLVIEQTLAARGLDVVTAAVAREGLDLFAAARSDGRPFHAVVADGRMPEMDGFELISALRETGADPATVLMFSSSDRAADASRANALGVGGYLVKPVKGAELVEALRRVLRDAPTAGTAREQARRHILLVEDTPDNRLLIKAYLKKTDFVVDEAENGRIGLDMFRDGDYGLVLMDVQMPVMDGHAATRAIRAFEKSRGREPVPIVALTAHAIQEEMDKSLAAGCTAHLPKPVKKQVLIDCIRQYLGDA